MSILLLVASAAAQDVTRLEKIGDVASVARDDSSVILNCTDNSQVRISVLAPDLIRVRASFSKQLSNKDHSWAIEKTNWPTPRWNLVEMTNAVVIKTDEVEVVVRRSPLLIEFRDAKTGGVINADERPLVVRRKRTPQVDHVRS